MAHAGLGRFERKIVMAILAVAVMPLAAALWLGQRVLHEAYTVGVNPQVVQQLDQGLGLYRRHLSSLREAADRTALAVSGDHMLHLALAVNLEGSAPGSSGATEVPDPEGVNRALARLLVRFDNIIELRIRDGQGRVRGEARGSGGALRLRELRLERPLQALSDLQIEVTVGAPAGPFEDYQRAGEMRRIVTTLQRGSAYVSGFYLAVYITLLLSAIAVAVAVGIVLSRRVTRRVSQLAEATARVGRGDLAVFIPDDDADEVGELTRAFNDMVRDLSESRERIDYLQRVGAWQEFARRLAHEIKNPLTPIQLAVQEADRAYKGDDAEYRAMLSDTRTIVEEEVQTLRRLVGEFSEFARLPEVRLETADLVEVVKELANVHELRNEAEREEGLLSVGLELDLPTHPLRLEVDTMLLRRALDNLLRNAVEALRAGPVTARARMFLSVRELPSEVRVEVRDSGLGVAAEDRTRIFDPYFTTKSEGTGLGLAIVKKIVLEHGGLILCCPAPEGGACMRIRLPLKGALLGEVDDGAA